MQQSKLTKQAVATLRRVYDEFAETPSMHSGKSVKKVELQQLLMRYANDLINSAERDSTFNE